MLGREASDRNRVRRAATRLTRFGHCSAKPSSLSAPMNVDTTFNIAGTQPPHVYEKRFRQYDFGPSRDFRFACPTVGGGRENRADCGRLVSTGLRAMRVRSTYARHRIRHGIRHTEVLAGRRHRPHVANERLRHRLIGSARVSTAAGSQSLAVPCEALLHELSLARTRPTDRILTCRCGMTLVGRGRSSD